MKKYNTILTKDTANQLVQRIQAMIDRKGYVIVNHEYTGKQAMKGYIDKVLKPEKWGGLSIISRSIPSIINQGDVHIEVDNRPTMQLVRINWGKNVYNEGSYSMGIAMDYGTKIYVTSEKIIWKDKLIVDGLGMTSSISYNKTKY